MPNTEVVAAIDQEWDFKVRRAAVIARSGVCPEVFKGKPDDILVAGMKLAENDVKFGVGTLSQVYVVNGVARFMAQLQIALAHRAGHDIVPVRQDDQAAAVSIRLKGSREWHDVGFTMAEAASAGLDKKAGDMYKKWPGRMLLARATTKAIGIYCPEVLLGIESNVDYSEAETAPSTPPDDDPVPKAAGAVTPPSAPAVPLDDPSRPFE